MDEEMVVNLSKKLTKRRYCLILLFVFLRPISLATLDGPQNSSWSGFLSEIYMITPSLHLNLYSEFILLLRSTPPSYKMTFPIFDFFSSISLLLTDKLCVSHHPDLEYKSFIRAGILFYSLLLS